MLCYDLNRDTIMQGRSLRIDYKYPCSVIAVYPPVALENQDAEKEKGGQMFRKILVCLDGSNLSEQILRYVSEEASSSDKKMILLNVVTLPIATPIAIPGDASNITPMLPTPEQIAADEAKAEKYLEKKAQSLKELGIKTKCVVVMGDPGSAIVDYAEKNAIDLIAIATHGRSGLRRILFGSVAEYVIKHSKLPILLIKPK